MQIAPEKHSELKNKGSKGFNIKLVAQFDNKGLNGYI